MSEEPEFDPSRLVSFRYNVPDKGDPHMEICMKYKGVHLDIGFDDNDEGNQDAAQLFAAYPSVMRHIASEVAIQQEVAEVDQDLLDLLSEGEAEQ